MRSNSLKSLKKDPRLGCEPKVPPLRRDASAARVIPGYFIPKFLEKSRGPREGDQNEFPEFGEQTRFHGHGAGAAHDEGGQADFRHLVAAGPFRVTISRGVLKSADGLIEGF